MMASIFFIVVSFPQPAAIMRSAALPVSRSRAKPEKQELPHSRNDLGRSLSSVPENACGPTAQQLSTLQKLLPAARDMLQCSQLGRFVGLLGRR